MVPCSCSEGPVGRLARPTGSRRLLGPPSGPRGMARAFGQSALLKPGSVPSRVAIRRAPYV
eukprot:5638682-Alexandrium_andersonii.AAC.1